ncbi:MAG: hypothetical protein JWS10_1227 [Cypionkella sp.]|uniref:hypothetical protein n=1 Tax=Cypionkella sp. TaxID=2811411 RepID=UPI00260A5E80|nr:hypothetical protein [Cypionkella sp.]MDB5658612.1 hypothetical protein [Cypionkella sp.]
MTQEETTPYAGRSDEATSMVGSVAADLQAAASRTFDNTVAQVKSQANDAKASVASEVSDAASALRRASEEMRGGSPQERTLGKIASSLADASDALRDKDLGEILQAASRVARENPVLFLGGAALLGFAASRFAKASSGQLSRLDFSQTSQSSYSAQDQDGSQMQDSSQSQGSSQTQGSSQSQGGAQRQGGAYAFGGSVADDGLQEGGLQT